MDKSSIEPALYQVVDEFNERKVTHKQFRNMFLNLIYTFWNGNGRTCKILFADQISNTWTILVHSIKEYQQTNLSQMFHFWTRFISRPQYISNDNIFFKSEFVLFRYWDELCCYAWLTLSCCQLSFWMGHIVLLTMETFSQMEQTKASIYRENTTKCRFINFDIFI